MLQKTRNALGLALLATIAASAVAQPGGDGGGRPGGFTPPTPEQFVERMMQNDANGDGKLARDELPGRFADRMFETGDANKDGFLDKAELTEIAKTMGQGGFGGRGGDRQGGPGAGGPGAGGAGGPQAGGAPASFDAHMKSAGRAMRQLRRSGFDDASRQSDLVLIQTIQDSLVGAKARIAEVEMAPQAKKQYGDDKVKYESDFRLNLIQAIMESLALESAVVEGDTAGAKESLEHLLQVQKEGHDAFQKPEDENERPAAPGESLPAPRRVRPGDTQKSGG
ncbi:MAG: hypothetical protein IPJ41_06865 [Phycisphaerales bacterium]|nr:hypothetical protein [Phycisphaerales bacterium]